MPHHIRPATLADLPALLRLAEAARGVMARNGNPQQWAGGYPQADVLQRDITGGHSFVIENENGDASVIGAFALVPAPEPSYAHIDGAWLDDAVPNPSYYTVHRIMGQPGAKGIFAGMLEFAFARCGNIRMDTHADNRIMQHLLGKHGFTCCGIIQLPTGRGARLAYQKILHP